MAALCATTSSFNARKKRTSPQPSLSPALHATTRPRQTSQSLSRCACGVGESAPQSVAAASWKARATQGATDGPSAADAPGERRTAKWCVGDDGMAEEVPLAADVVLTGGTVGDGRKAVAMEREALRARI